MAKPEHVKCGNCVFFDAEGEACNRFPPKVYGLGYLSVLLDAQLATSQVERNNAVERAITAHDSDPFQFPDVTEDDWCGEFRSEWPQ